MQLPTLILAALVAYAAALPQGDKGGAELNIDPPTELAGKNVCKGWKSGGTPMCCDSSVASLVGYNCKELSDEPADDAGFKATCAEVHKDSYCCRTGIMFIGVMCNRPN